VNEKKDEDKSKQEEVKPINHPSPEYFDESDEIEHLKNNS
tara:strand:+ start:261 stop:380 length:120 start_codon:yes stop_codon:yes gene_type:complete